MMPGLYIHVPFCAHACPYCDFSFELLRGGRVGLFLDAFSIELDRKAAAAPWRNVTFDTVFLGGGTPTCLTTGRLTGLFERLRVRVRIAADAEITAEANPETLTDAKLGALRASGVNRLSLGVQAFDARSLRRLGRHHSAECAVRTVARAREAGFGNLNIDLIFGAPEQTREAWTETLAAVLALAPEHVSTYGLTVEEDTPFGRRAAAGRLPLPPEDAALAMYNEAIDRLTAHGYHHYEVSNFARAGAACRHNLTYWTGGDYLGLGPSAHSHVAGRRSANTRRLDAYLRGIDADGDATEQTGVLTETERVNESILLGLRMTAGLDRRVFVSRFGVERYEARRPVITRLTDAGLLERDDRRLRLTRRGLAVADTVCMELMDAAEG